MTWLFAALGLARKALQALLGLVARYPLQCALVASLCLSGWLWMGRRDAIAERERQVASLERQVTAWKDANAKAREWALAEKKLREARARANKERTDANERTLTTASLSAADRYARANKCVRAESPDRLGPDLPGPAPDPQGPVGDDPEPDLVGISRADLDACTVIHSRLTVAREWALDLQKP